MNPDLLWKGVVLGIILFVVYRLGYLHGKIVGHTKIMFWVGTYLPLIVKQVIGEITLEGFKDGQSRLRSQIKKQMESVQNAKNSEREDIS